MLSKPLLGAAASAAGVLLLLLLLAGWQAKHQYDRAVAAEQAIRIHEGARIAAEKRNAELKHEMQRTEAAREQAATSARHARERADQLTRDLRDAREQASEEYRDCMSMRLPDAVRERLLHGADGAGGQD